MKNRPEMGDTVRYAHACAYDNDGTVLAVKDWGKGSSYTALVEWPNGTCKWYRASQLVPVDKE